MEIFLVGGAVRDELLGQQPRERDWLVVGASYEECLARGWRPVAKNMPVFRSPDTQEEYAMARTESKTGVGYRGFDFSFGPEISLKDDLVRRDLTINALAKDSDGNIVDPYGFLEDLHARRLRHISERFTEDPLRIVRLCSLYARLRPYGFTIDPETLGLITAMTSTPQAQEELESLSPQHLWAQLLKALESDAPEAFADALDQSGAGPALLPEGLLTEQGLARLAYAGKNHSTAMSRLSVWIGTLDPEARASFLDRYEAPKAFRGFCAKVDELYPFYVDVIDKPIPEILDIFKRLGAFDDSELFTEQIHCCHSLLQCQGLSASPQVQKDFLVTMMHCALRIDRGRILRRNIEGTPQMATEIDKHRCAEMIKVRRYYPWSHLSVGKTRPN